MPLAAGAGLGPPKAKPPVDGAGVLLPVKLNGLLVLVAVEGAVVLPRLKPEEADPGVGACPNGNGVPGFLALVSSLGAGVAPAAKENPTDLVVAVAAGAAAAGGAGAAAPNEKLANGLEEAATGAGAAAAAEGVPPTALRFFTLMILRLAI